MFKLWVFVGGVQADPSSGSPAARALGGRYGIRAGVKDGPVDRFVVLLGSQPKMGTVGLILIWSGMGIGDLRMGPWDQQDLGWMSPFSWTNKLSPKSDHKSTSDKSSIISAIDLRCLGTSPSPLDPGCPRLPYMPESSEKLHLQIWLMQFLLRWNSQNEVSSKLNPRHADEWDSRAHWCTVMKKMHVPNKHFDRQTRRR